MYRVRNQYGHTVQLSPLANQQLQLLVRKDIRNTQLTSLMNQAIVVLEGVKRYVGWEYVERVLILYQKLRNCAAHQEGAVVGSIFRELIDIRAMCVARRRHCERIKLDKLQRRLLSYTNNLP